MIQFLTPHDVTEDAVAEIATSLRTKFVAEFHVGVSSQSTLTARVVAAWMPKDEYEIMVAMEGAGCIFITRETNINPFVFVTAGFQLTAAQIVTKLFVGLAHARTDREESRALQLTHQDRS